LLSTTPLPPAAGGLCPQTSAQTPLIEKSLLRHWLKNFDLKLLIVFEFFGFSASVDILKPDFVFFFCNFKPANCLLRQKLRENSWNSNTSFYHCDIFQLMKYFIQYFIVDFFIFKLKILDFVMFFSCQGLETGLLFLILSKFDPHFLNFLSYWSYKK